MNPIDLFQNLKKEVLLVYKERYPYFTGTWKSFSAQDILNLIALIESSVKQTVSEKWIYTHLKPETNNKLPRKDMLDILSQLVGFSGWDEFVFKHKKEVVLPIKKSENKKNKILLWSVSLVGILLISSVIIYLEFYKNSNSHSIEVKDSFSNNKINNDDFKAVIIKDSTEIPVEIIDSELQINTKDSTKVVIKSPFYEDQVIVVRNEKRHQDIVLKPDDYAMMLKAFMKSDIKDWQTRKKQLNKILADDLEVIVMLKNDLGAEYFNKQEFSEKLIIPSQSLQKMKIIDIQNNQKQQINFIRIIQQ
jgi:predicted DNA-binding transcriptional regulator AlpA